MKAYYRRKKGKRLELKVAALIRNKGLDERAQRMPLSGAMTHLEGDIHTRLPYHFECKNQERVQLWEFWEQTRSQAPAAHAPVLVVSGNFRPILAVVDVELLLNLLRIEQDYLKTATETPPQMRRTSDR